MIKRSSTKKSKSLPVMQVGNPAPSDDFEPHGSQTESDLES